MRFAYRPDDCSRCSCTVTTTQRNNNCLLLSDLLSGRQRGLQAILAAMACPNEVSRMANPLGLPEILKGISR